MSDWVLLGKIIGLHGLQGWVKIFSYTCERAGIADYKPLYLSMRGEWRPVELEQSRLQGKGVAFKFAGYDDRDAAVVLLGCDIAVPRAQLPEPEPGEYYWADLEGLRVETVAGVELGTVERLFETGANDVLVVKGERERLIPFIQGRVVVGIDLEQGLIRVDWDPDF